MKIPSQCKWKSTGRNLGAGGAAEVIEVIDRTEEHSSPAALKALRPNKPPEFYNRFRNEMAALKQLNHPNIIEIIDFSDDPSFPFYVMPLLGNAMSLRQQIAKGTNPFTRNAETAIQLLKQMLSALSCCEQHQIVHRDLSPANLLILDDNQIKLIDFGLCHFETGERQTLLEEGVGTPNYMAPECESGNNSTVSCRSDFYSVGKILWAAVANQEAFAREKLVFTTKSFNQMFASSPLLWHLDYVFEKTIRLDPENRWKNSSEALSECEVLESLIATRALSIHQLKNTCPHCRIGQLRIDDKDWHLFHNPMPEKKRGMNCNKCGYCFVRDLRTYEAYFTERLTYT